MRKRKTANQPKRTKREEPYFPKTDVVCPECGERFHITADPDANGKKCECPACECKLLTVVQQMGDRLAWSVNKQDTRPKGPTAMERSDAGL